jgi:hypothetical protein
VNCYYETNPFESWFTPNGWGRLAVVEYGLSYSHTSGGLPVKKKLWVYSNGLGGGSLVGEWSYDSKGNILRVKYPDTYGWQGNPLTGRTNSSTSRGGGMRRSTTVSNGTHDITRRLQGDCKPIKPGAP